MGAKTEALARQFEGKARDAVADAGEAWRRGLEEGDRGGAMDGGRDAPPSGRGLEAVAGIVTGIVSGGRHAATHAGHAGRDERPACEEHAGCTRAETLALFQKGAATASAVVRGLNDDQLAKSGTVFTDVPPMTAEQLIMLGLLGHIDDHMGSIRKTIGM